MIKETILSQDGRWEAKHLQDQELGQKKVKIIIHNREIRTSERGNYTRWDFLKSTGIQWAPSDSRHWAESHQGKCQGRAPSRHPNQRQDYDQWRKSMTALRKEVGNPKARDFQCLLVPLPTAGQRSKVWAWEHRTEGGWVHLQKRPAQQPQTQRLPRRHRHYGRENYNSHPPPMPATASWKKDPTGPGKNLQNLELGTASRQDQ